MALNVKTRQYDLMQRSEHPSVEAGKDVKT